MLGVADEKEKEDAPKNIWYRFTQQRLRAWQPVPAPKVIISIYLVCGVFFSVLGIGLLLISWSVREYVYDYTDVEAEETGVGTFTIPIDRDMEPPIWVYYGLDGFHQNHRRYINSRPDMQLEEVDMTFDPTLLAECLPWVVSAIDGRINYPCGLIARSIFNDSYVLTVKSAEADPWRVIDVDSKASSIAWSSDLDGKFKNVDPESVAGTRGIRMEVEMNMWLNRLFPPVECRQKEVSVEKPLIPVTVGIRKEPITQADDNSATVEVVDCTGFMRSNGQDPPRCNFQRLGQQFSCDDPDYKKVYVDDWGVASGHFIVWMRVAGLPLFRKLWGVINEPIKAGSRLRVHVMDNFPVKTSYGRKAFIITTTSMLGGRNDFLGYGYLVVGCCCLLFGCALLCRQMRDPRPLGDISLLVQNQ